MKPRSEWRLGCLAVTLSLLSLALWSRGPASISTASEGVPDAAPALAAIWSSGWVPINQGQTLTLNHNLGGDPLDYAVELWFRDTDGALGINRYGYSGLEVSNQWQGAFWHHLSSSSIRVTRLAADPAAEQISVRVWVPPAQTEYDSGWTDINPGQTRTFFHSLGVTPDELTVGLWFRGSTLGVHQYAFGGLTEDTPLVLHGAYWHNLTDNAVRVSREPNDTDVEQVRVVVVRSDPPDYDSLWQAVSPGPPGTAFAHNLNWNPNMLLVRGECLDPGDPLVHLGVHQRFAGGNHDNLIGWQGMHLQNLTANSVKVVRRADDLVCPQVRIRIWRFGRNIFVPYIGRNDD
jgi:hypothetical protein